MSPSVVVVSAWNDGMHYVGRTTWGGKVSYAGRHGYGIGGCLVRGDDPEWMKLDAIREAMTVGVEWVMWLDADAAITNESVTIEAVIGDTAADLIVNWDINGLNAGVLFVRNTDWSRGMLSRWRKAGRRFGHYPNCEQTTLAYMLYAEPKEKWACVPQKACNSYRYSEYGYSYPEGDWRPGDFVLHLPSLSTDRRIDILRGVIGVGEVSAARPRRLRTGWFDEYFDMSAPVLDIGCGRDPICPDAVKYDRMFGSGDATTCADIADESYLFVNASHVLEHLHDPRAAVKNWYRILGPGGRMLIAVPHRELYEKRKALPSRWNDDHKWMFMPEHDEPPQTLGLRRLIEQQIPGGEIVYFGVCNEGWVDLGPDVHSVGEYGIEVVVRKPEVVK